MVSISYVGSAASDVGSAARETLSLQELARLLGLGSTLAYELAAKNELPIPVFKIGRKYYAFREHYDAFKADQLALWSVTAH